ncbi:hypothetical protein WN943_015674 [Citrus x changshan-huyou]
MMFLGDEISESLVNAIEASAISVIVFSESYASSRWCLDELVKILDCKKEYAQIVIPVFYQVDPSDVRNQTGSFGDSFSKLEERLKENTEKLQSWRNALEEAASVESKDVYSLGIWGIGGIGKTTIARASFDKISRYFEVDMPSNETILMLVTRNFQASSSFNGENKCKVSYLQDPGFAEVKYFYWYGYPLKSLPSNLNAEKLLFLELPGSDIEQLCNGVKRHGKSNQIIHAACKKLIAKIPSPTLIPHPNNLVALNLTGSKSLKSLPARIFNLEFLIELDLSGCSKLKRLPDISSGNISRLYLSGTAIEELPSSFELLLRLSWLDLSDCKMLKSLPSSLWN